MAGAVLLSVGAVVAYGVGQQAARTTIDDSPRAALEQSRVLLTAGAPPGAAAAGPAVGLAPGNPTFVIVYDGEHRVLASSAALSGSVPDVPPGVLDVAAVRGEDRVTWQPAAGIREAVVAAPGRSAVSHGVVVAGTSLTATENRTGVLRDGSGSPDCSPSSLGSPLSAG